MIGTKTITVAATLLALSASTSIAADFEMKIGVSTPDGYSYNQGLAAFEKAVEEGSKTSEVPSENLESVSFKIDGFT